MAVRASVPAVVPDAGGALRQVAPAGGDHLVGDLEQQRGHSLGGVVVLRDAVDHPDAGHQSRDVLQHPGLWGGGDPQQQQKFYQHVTELTVLLFHCCVKTGRRL